MAQHKVEPFESTGVVLAFPSCDLLDVVLEEQYIPWHEDDNRVLGRTPIFGAAQTGGVNNIRRLLKQGADPNARDYRDNTPLHVATTAAVAKLLIARGATVDAPNEDGQTPLLRRKTRLHRRREAAPAPRRQRRCCGQVRAVASVRYRPLLRLERGLVQVA
ncbi:hypothetical protein PybrP1_002352 [[Pythium] brassicae (nom. inval.)]|nr:hypothetical protein PybrP1_002352 [[Pythium] brassicae (nom. inval.)]